MSVTAADVNKLRQITGAGLMDCKKALVETNGDFDAAIDYLRKKGQKVSEKRADREANEGVVIARTSEDNKAGIIVHITSETDFVAKNEDFIRFAQQVADTAINKNVKSKEELLSQNLDGSTVSDKLNEQVGKIGEKIEVGAFERVEAETVVPYIHAGYKIGVLVGFNKANNSNLIEAGREVAMQIAAMRPIAVDKEDVDTAVVEREMEIGREQARQEGKPENIIDKIAQGKVQKFYKENTLVNQDFVKDSSKTVGQRLKEVDQDLKVTSFKRVALG